MIDTKRNGHAATSDSAVNGDPCAVDLGESEDELDALQYDPNARDILGDFGLDDEEALPDDCDFWFDADEGFDD